MSTPLFFSLFFCVTAFISSYIGGVDLNRVLSYSILLIGVTLIVEDGIYVDIDAFIKGTLFFFEILVYLSLIYYVFNPTGYDVEEVNSNYYLLGNYNTTIRKVFPGICLGAIYAFKNKNRFTLRYALMCGALFYFLITVGAVNSSIGLLTFVIGLIYYCISNKNTIFRYEYFVIVSVVLTIMFAILGQFQIFEVIITGVLNKDMTLSSRTSVWAAAIDLIQERWIWGHGQVETAVNRKLMHAAAAHNIYLDILYYSGIVGLIILILIIVVVGKKLISKRNELCAPVVIFEVIFCAYFLMWNFDTYGDINSFYMMFSVFTMAYHCEEFISYHFSDYNYCIS